PPLRMSRERSRNVAWNQQLDQLCSHRGLGAAGKVMPAQGRRPRGGLGGAHVAVFAMCASRGRLARLAHIAKSAMYAPPSLEAFQKGGRFGWRTRGGVCHVCVERRIGAARTHRKKRDVCATQRLLTTGIGFVTAS